MKEIYEPSEIKEFIELLANTDTPPDPNDFAIEERKKSTEGVVKKYINMYRLLKPGTKEEKVGQIMAVLGEDSPKAEIVEQELLERPARPGEKYLEIRNMDVEKDDAEYQLAQELATELPEAANGRNLAAFEDALFAKEADSSKTIASLEGCLGNPLTAEQRRSLEQGFGKLSEWLGGLAAETEAPAKSAEQFKIHHERFNRERTIPNFNKILAKKLCVPLVGFLSDALKKGSDDPVGDALKKLEMLKKEATSVYTEVAQKGVPAFRTFTEYLENAAAEQTGGERTFAQGEFHVGRDTKNTTYVARMARLWGTMSAKERQQSVRFIDVSRMLVDNVPRAVLAEHLRQNGINDQMMGLDGGYRGSSPQDVLLAVMSGERRKELLAQQQDVILELNPQIRLMETNQEGRGRSFDPQNETGDIVHWMESLPKFTERSQTLVRSSGDGLGKYLVLTRKKNISEQTLAWVVQHAVWREMAPRSE
jgi:hypothetical protein